MDAAETFASLWEYCCSNNRLVPNPEAWSKMYEMLEGRRHKRSGGWDPPSPLILAAWHFSSPEEKQRRFKNHLEWAEAHGQTSALGESLRSLSEDDWCHWGEI